MHTCRKCNKSFTRQNNLRRHEKEVCKGDHAIPNAIPNFIADERKRDEKALQRKDEAPTANEHQTFPENSTLKRQKIEPIPDRLDWEIKDDSYDEDSDDEVTSDEEDSEAILDDIKKDFGLWLNKLAKLKDNPNRLKKGKGIGPKYNLQRGGAIHIPEIPRRVEKIPEATPEEEDDAEEIAALENLIGYEKKELLNLLKEFAAVIDEEDESKLIELERVLNNFFISDKDDKDWETLPKVHRQLDGLIRSKIPRIELIRAKILTNDLDKKRRILQMFSRIKDRANFDEVAKRLWQEGMISGEVDEKLQKLEDPNSENIVEILKNDLPGFVPF